MARLSFQPKEISTDNIDCLSNTDENLPMVTLTACFEMIEMTQSSAGRDLNQYYNSLMAADAASYQYVIAILLHAFTGAHSSGLNIFYMLDVDPMRQTYRGFFSQTDKKARNHTVTYNLKAKDTCFNYSIYMPVWWFLNNIHPNIFFL